MKCGECKAFVKWYCCGISKPDDGQCRVIGLGSGFAILRKNDFCRIDKWQRVRDALNAKEVKTNDVS